MARAIKHIKAGLLHLEIIGTVPEQVTGRRRFKPGGPKVDAKCLHWFPVPAVEVVDDEDS